VRSQLRRDFSDAFGDAQKGRVDVLLTPTAPLPPITVLAASASASDPALPSAQPGGRWRRACFCLVPTSPPPLFRFGLKPSFSFSIDFVTTVSDSTARGIPQRDPTPFSLFLFFSRFWCACSGSTLWPVLAPTAAELYANDVMTVPANLAGLPALSLPAATTTIPIGAATVEVATRFLSLFVQRGMFCTLTLVDPIFNAFGPLAPPWPSRAGARRDPAHGADVG
jgi:hypothetical protein